MIEFHASTALTFSFPAPIAVAYEFYAARLAAVATYLPRIDLVEQYSDERFRLAYRSLELNAYEIELLCDVRIEPDPDVWVIRVTSYPDAPPVKQKRGIRSATGRGLYRSTSTFTPADNQTDVRFELSLSGMLPRPRSMSLLPGSVVNGVATRITRLRIQEIATGFIQATCDEFVAMSQADQV